MANRDLHKPSRYIGESKRIVVKVGSSLLCDENGGVRRNWLAGLAQDISSLRPAGRDVLVVSSGAIALGRRLLGFQNVMRLEEKQAASAAGQAVLTGAWQSAFDPMGTSVAQVLLTLEDTEHRRRYLNARATLETLLAAGALPLINENDTIATTEIRYGDNDRLAAHTAQLVGADLLIILSDVEGLFSGDPQRDMNANFIDHVPEISADIEAMAGGANTARGVGSGGMASKIAAAKIARDAGCATIIASGQVDHPIREIISGSRATMFDAAETRESARRRWISGRLKPTGSIVIDAGAARALRGGASLLPAGVKRVEGNVRRGDAVAINDEANNLIGQGLCAYDQSELLQIIGAQSDQIEKILGYRRRPAVIERDDLVLRSEGDGS